MDIIDSITTANAYRPDPIATGLSLMAVLTVAPFVIAYVIATLVCGYVAGKKGHGGVAWMLLAYLVTPLLALLALAALPDARPKDGRPV